MEDSPAEGLVEAGVGVGKKDASLLVVFKNCTCRHSKVHSAKEVGFDGLDAHQFIHMPHTDFGEHL